MATKKRYWYVLVITEEGPKFVTEVDFGNKSAKWIATDEPYELSESWSNDLVLGLAWNGFLAYQICSQVEIKQQPYRYAFGHMNWTDEE